MSTLISPPLTLPTLHETYTAIPSLSTALPNLTTLVLTLINGPIRVLFHVHNLRETHGLLLLHKHFDIAPSERLVEHGPSTSPWTVGDTQDAVTEIPGGLGWVKPRSWHLMSHSGAVTAVPVEFAYSPTKPTETPLPPQFIQALGTPLSTHGLLTLLGVQDVQSQDPELTLEIHQGRNNVMVRPGQANREFKKTSLWTFGATTHDAECIDTKGNPGPDCPPPIRQD